MAQKRTSWKPPVQPSLSTVRVDRNANRRLIEIATRTGLPLRCVVDLVAELALTHTAHIPTHDWSTVPGRYKSAKVKGPVDIEVPISEHCVSRLRKVADSIGVTCSALVTNTFHMHRDFFTHRAWPRKGRIATGIKNAEDRARSAWKVYRASDDWTDAPDPDEESSRSVQVKARERSKTAAAEEKVRAALEELESKRVADAEVVAAGG